MPSNSEESSKKESRSSSKPSQTEKTSEEVPKKSGDSTKPSGAQASDPSKGTISKPEIKEQQTESDVANTEGDSLVDMETFGQLLEMDDDDEHTFSKSLTWDYFDQAVTTFNEMDAAVLSGDLITLSRKGHFLKGSSAALGLNKVKASCEKMRERLSLHFWITLVVLTTKLISFDFGIEHYGNRKKANGEGTLTEDEAMERCKELLEQLKDEQTHSKAWLEVRGAKI
ncbi:signal transduction histidine kinase [Melampsora americana]|nr:signal transduction histidine kinase [Melampsora americana]